MLVELFQERAIVQAPMAGVQGVELCVAVCEAGGIGSLPAAMLSIDALRAALAQIEGQTSQPYNVNFFCHTPPAANTAAQRRWREALQPYYEELGADTNAPPGPARAPFNQAALTVLSEFKPAIVSFHFGLPSTALLQGVKDLGIAVMGCATTADEALWLQCNGADAVIAQGGDAGGHQGCFLPAHDFNSLKSIELAAAVCKKVDLPVIAAGGIATRDDALAALAAGAAAVQLGSAYLQAHEANTSELHRAALQSDAARITELTNVFSGRRARGIVNRVMRELGPISDLTPAFPDAAQAMAPLRSAAEQQGSADFSPFWSGERGYLSQVASAAEITRAINPK